jgi:hypothetical protein
MARSDRRFAVRAVLAVTAAAIGALASTVVSEAAASNPLVLNVQVGYSQTVKLGQWMPVSIDLANHGADLDGVLQVSTSSSFGGGGGPPGGNAVYETQVSLASGATKHFRTYVSEDFPGTVDVSVIRNNRILITQQVAFNNTLTGLLAAVISDQPTALDNLGIIFPGPTSPHVVHLASGDISDSALVLRAFDLIAIDDFASDTLTSGQRSALTDYVMNGGSLILGTGGSWHKTLAGLPTSLLPMQVTGTTTFPTSAALGHLGGLEVATGTLTGGTAWLSDGGHPLLIEEKAGAGLVSMATFDWTQDPIASWSGSIALLRQVFIRSTYGNGANPNGGGAMFSKFGLSGSVATKGGSLSQILASLPTLDLPAWWLIGALVGLYVLLVGPVNYFVLRALNRRTLAWITVPALALVASGGAYSAGVVTKGTSVLANEISIVHVQTGWDRAYQEAYTGIMAPTRGDYQVGIAGGRTMISPIYYTSGGATDPNLGAMHVNTTTDGITLPGMTAFNLRGFATEGVIGSAPRIVAHAQVVGGQITGTVQNLSSIHFTDGLVLAGNSFHKLGDLPANGTASFSVQPVPASQFNGQPISMTIYPSAYSCCPPQAQNSSDTERENEARGAVLSVIPATNFNGMFTSPAPTVVLWTKQSFQEVTVNGGHPRMFGESAVVLPLSVGEIGAGAVPASLVPGRIVDLDTDLGQGGAPTVVIQAGTITYDFAPTLAPGTHFFDVSISSFNPFGGKGAIGPAGTAANVKAQVWDWSQSAWMSIDYYDNAAMAVPAPAVNPSTGEVRLKLTADNQFTTGNYSVVGTVK